MIVLAGFAFLSGIITILSPCILPVLPVVLAGGAGGGKQRPLGIISGFVLSFTGFTVALAALTRATGVSAGFLRWIAMAVLVLFGLVMIVPHFSHLFELFTSKLSSALNNGKNSSSASMQNVSLPGSKKHNGYLSGLPVGMSLGILWTPCVGPILASVITLALASSIDAGAFIITLAYSLGTAIPMLAIMLGGRSLLNKFPVLRNNMTGIRRGFGVVMIFLALSIAMGWDIRFQTAVLQAFPGYGSNLTAIENSDIVRQAISNREEQLISRHGELTTEEGVFTGTNGDQSMEGMVGMYGRAPSISAGNGSWINSPPLTNTELRGKVVLVDFWTYSCVNCIRTMPYLRDWNSKYADSGLVIVGVHSPEFAFERDIANVRSAVEDLQVTWPVVLDNDYVVWRSYANRFWPAHYLIDAEGQVRYFTFGEGHYRETEQLIQSLLIEAGYNPSAVLSREITQEYAGTPETYLGLRRAERFGGSPQLRLGRETYSTPEDLVQNQWSLNGEWLVGAEYAQSTSDESAVLLEFEAKHVYAVLAAPDNSAAGESAAGEAPDTANPVARVSVDGGPFRDIELTGSRMYDLAEFGRESRHNLRLELPEGARIYTFTFGG